MWLVETDEEYYERMQHRRHEEYLTQQHVEYLAQQEQEYHMEQERINSMTGLDWLYEYEK